MSEKLGRKDCASVMSSYGTSLLLGFIGINYFLGTNYLYQHFKFCSFIRIYLLNEKIKVANLESMVSGHRTTLLEHAITMRTSCFDNHFASQMKLTELPLIHCFVHCWQKSKPPKKATNHPRSACVWLRTRSGLFSGTYLCHVSAACCPHLSYLICHMYPVGGVMSYLAMDLRHLHVKAKVFQNSPRITVLGYPGGGTCKCSMR